MRKPPFCICKNKGADQLSSFRTADQHLAAKLICVFVFEYAKIRFSHDAAHYPCHTLFKNASGPGALDLHFTLH